MKTWEQRQDAWGAVGLAPLPILAPAYRLVDEGQGHVWGSHYRPDNWTIEMLDDRWALDATTAPLPDDGYAHAFSEAGLRRGDIVLWIGPAQVGRRIRQVLWPPSLVVDVQPAMNGYQRVKSVRDTWLAVIPVDSPQAEHLARMLSLRFPNEDAPRCRALERSVLDAWGLDVWCYRCGHMGTPVQWGVTGEAGTRDTEQDLTPWPTGLALTPDFEAPARAIAFDCERCGTQWGAPPIAEPQWWPEAPSLLLDSVRVIANHDELLEVFGCADTEELQERLSERENCAVRVEAEEVLCWLEAGESWSQMYFPMTKEAFLLDVHDTVGYSYAEQVTSLLRQEIWTIEGIWAPLNDVCGLNGSIWPDEGFPRMPRYRYSRPAPGSWTVAQWLEQRLVPLLKRGTFWICEIGLREETTLNDLRALGAPSDLAGD